MAQKKRGKRTMRFSVVIPAYNVKDYLEKCVASVVDQTFPDWEIILVDDGSTDGATGALCDRLSETYGAQIRVIHQENGGLGAARNTGLEAACGEYVAFLDSDDHVAADMLEKLNCRIEETHCDIYTFGYTVDKDGVLGETFIDDLPVGTPFTLEQYPRLLLATPNACNRIYRREFFVNSGIRYPGRVWFEDIRTTMKLFALAERIEALAESFYYYVVREGSITRSSTVDRNCEIMDAFDDLLCFYKEQGIYGQYEAELTRLAIDHLYLAASVRVLMIDRKHKLLPELKAYMKKNFPQYRSNPYFSEISKPRKLAFSLLEKNGYGMLYTLFRIKGH